VPTQCGNLEQLRALTRGGPLLSARRMTYLGRLRALAE